MFTIQSRLTRRQQNVLFDFTLRRSPGAVIAGIESIPGTEAISRWLRAILDSNRELVVSILMEQLNLRKQDKDRPDKFHLWGDREDVLKITPVMIAAAQARLDAEWSQPVAE